MTAWTEGEPPWTGPWAEDARRIFELLQAAAARYEEQHAAGEHPAECTYCPLCQGLALVRRSGPDVLDRVAELAAGLAATLRAGEPEDGAGEPPGAGAGTSRGDGVGATPGEGGGAPTPGPGGANRPPTTVRIDITD